MTEQPRDADGRFAEVRASESGAELTTGGGTFYFPPTVGSSRELVDFWSQVQIPDEALVRFREAYRTVSAQAIDTGLAEWDRANPAPTGRRGEEPRAGWESRREQHARALRSTYPTMYTDRVRPLVRLQRIRWQAHSLPEADRQALMAREWVLGSDRGTLDHYAQRYQFDRFADRVLNSPPRDRTDELISLLQDIRFHTDEAGWGARINAG